MNQLGTKELPLTVAVVGSGPSGFFAAGDLLRRLDFVRVDLFDRLPTPFGLLRAGVAPDRPRIKALARLFERTLDDPRCRFFGNVAYGEALGLDDLRRHYDAIVFAVGAPSHARLGIPGEGLVGSLSATEVVGWYNGCPDFAGRAPPLDGERVAVAGHGNVAADIARMLLLPAEALGRTDLPGEVVKALSASKVREVRLVGRRGPAQMAFSLDELEGLASIDGCALQVDAADLDVAGADREDLAASPEGEAKLDVLRRCASAGPPASGRMVRLAFFLRPKALHGEERVEAATFQPGRLAGPPGARRLVDEGDPVRMDCGLFIRSIGYRGVPLPGLPFDDARGVLPAPEGRLVVDGRARAGLYAAGWVRHGARGLIGHSKRDGVETAARLVEDLPHLQPAPVREEAGMVRLLDERGIGYTDLRGWRAVQREEERRGRAGGRPSEKIADPEVLVRLARDATRKGL